MSANLDTRENGVAAVFSVKHSMWHRGGTELDSPPTIEEGLELAGANWLAETEPVYVRRETPDGGEYFRKVTIGNAVTRSDRDIQLGLVGRRWTPLQNAVAFGVFQPMIDEGLASLKAGGCLKDGRDVWVQVEFNREKLGSYAQEVFGSLGVLPYGLLANNHSGTRQVILQETPIVVICQNTMRAAIAGWRGMPRAIGIKHSTRVEERTVAAALELWGKLIQRFDTVALQYRLLRATHLDTAMFRELVLDNVAPISAQALLKQEQGKLKGSAQKGLERAEAKRAEITRLWNGEGKGITGDHSAWEAYQAVTEGVQHNETLFKAKGPRLQSLSSGLLAQAMDRPLEALMEYACEQHGVDPSDEDLKAAPWTADPDSWKA